MRKKPIFTLGGGSGFPPPKKKNSVPQDLLIYNFWVCSTSAIKSFVNP